jgi:hypothetical protein
VRLFGKGALLSASVVLAAVLVPATAAFAATSTSTSTTTTGSRTIGTITPHTISTIVGGTGTGILPSANWSDTTGTGDGWNGTVAVSDFTYTGSWKQTSGSTTALSSSTGAFTGVNDGVEYTVTVGSSGSGTTTPFTWTSTDPTNSAGSGSTAVSATNGTPIEVGTRGVYINFVSGTTYASGTAYEIKVGTQSRSALSLDSSSSGAKITPSSTTTSPDPTWSNSGTTVTGGGTSNTYGTAVKFVSAAVNTGMGTYTIDPGVAITTDASSWVASYVAGVEYTIVTGP